MKRLWFWWVFECRWSPFITLLIAAVVSAILCHKLGVKWGGAE